MTVKEAIEKEREARMKPFLPLTPEPAISIPLDRIFIDAKKERGTATVTLADLAKCFDD